MLVGVGTVNVNSLINKIYHVFNFMISNKLSILSVCETWLTKSTPSSFVELPGFNFFRSDAGGCIKKHGVGIYVASHLTVSEVDVDFGNTLVIYVKEWSLYLMAVYRPPSYSEAENARLLDLIHEFCFGRKVILVGDFNLPTLKWLNEYTLDSYVTPLDLRFYEGFLECGLVQWVRDGTFVPSCNILDLIFTSEADSVGHFEVCPPFPNCFHSPVVISYLPITQSDQFESSELRTLWKRGNYDAINEDLLSVNWNSIFCDNISESYDNFIGVLRASIEQHVPTCGKKDRVVPWLKVPPRSLSNNRSRLWSSYKRTRSLYGRRDNRALEALGLFMEANRCLRNYSLQQRMDYESRLISSISSAPKLFHSYIRDKKKGRSAVGPLRVLGSLLDDPVDMTEVLADYFKSVFESSLPSTASDHQVADFTMQMPDITYDMVLEQLRSLDTNTSPGPDGVHPMLLKSCSTALALPLLMIFRKSLVSGCLPHFWKISSVIPIFKSGSKFSPCNYRPINLTCVTSKVMERILVKFMVLYLEQNRLISPDQFGYRSDRSTEDQLLGVYGEVCDAVWSILGMW